MDFNARYILVGERKNRKIRSLKKGELNCLTIYYMLKSMYSTGVVKCPSKHKLATKLGVHYSVLEKTFAYLTDNNLMEWTTCDKVRAIRMKNLVRGCEFQNYNHKVVYSFRKAKIANKSFEEVKAFIANLIIDISCKQQKYRVNQCADQSFLANVDHIHSYKQVKRRNRLERTLHGLSGAKHADLLTIISDSYISKLLGVSRPTANNLKHQIHYNEFAFFSTIETYLEPMTKREFKFKMEQGELNNKYYIKNGMLTKTVGTCYYNLKGKMDTYRKIRRISTMEAMQIAIGNRMVMGITDIVKSEMIALMVSQRNAILNQSKRINNYLSPEDVCLRES